MCVYVHIVPYSLDAVRHATSCQQQYWQATRSGGVNFLGYDCGINSERVVCKERCARARCHL